MYSTGVISDSGSFSERRTLRFKLRHRGVLLVRFARLWRCPGLISKYMKNLTLLVAALAICSMFAFGHTAQAAVDCTIPGNCGNGPIVANPVGWRHLDPGQEDCPEWFTFAGCVTPRPLGQTK